jgi:hypothetical protein
MSLERAFKIVLDAAVLQWAANTKQGELREALDRVLGQLGWNRTDHRGRALISSWMAPDDGRRP